jgi:hypothetical protein
MMVGNMACPAHDWRGIFRFPDRMSVKWMEKATS